MTADSILERRIEFSAGVQTLASVDELYSSMLYSGRNWFGKIDYTKISECKRSINSLSYSQIPRTASVSFHNGLLSPDSRLYGMTSFCLVYRYSYMRKLDVARINAYITGNVIFDMNATLGSIPLPELILAGLAPGIYLENKNSKHRIYLHLWSPILSYTLRNNYSTSITQNYEKLSIPKYIRDNSAISSINHLRALYTEIGYEQRFSSHFSLALNYKFHYITYSKPRSLKSVSGNYSLGTIYTF